MCVVSVVCRCVCVFELPFALYFLSHIYHFVVDLVAFLSIPDHLLSGRQAFERFDVNLFADVGTSSSDDHIMSPLFINCTSAWSITPHRVWGGGEKQCSGSSVEGHQWLNPVIEDYIDSFRTTIIVLDLYIPTTMVTRVSKFVTKFKLRLTDTVLLCLVMQQR